MTDRQLQIDALIALAKKLKAEGSPEQAERRYQQALQTADQIYGPGTPETGLVILEVITFYEDCGNAKDTEQLRKRLKDIFASEVAKLSLALDRSSAK